MLKRFWFGVFFLLVLVFWYSGSSQAQTPNLVKIKSEAIELNVDAILMPCENPADSLCAEFPVGGTHPDPNNHNHEFLISNGGFLPNTDIYIVGCINTPRGTKCTTGESNLDTLLNSLPGGDIMNKDRLYEFKAVANPVRSDNSGEISVIVRSYTERITTHMFNAYYIDEQDLSVTTTSTKAFVTPREALHLETFSQSTPTPRPVTGRPRVVIRRGVDQDPKGRSFDIKSLEPISGVEVTLLDNFKKLFEYKSINNPQTVKEDGEFSFWVPNGIYFLNLAQLPASHTWPVALDRVHPNYGIAYFCDPDVKNDKNEPVSLYYEQFSIIEYNKLVHCDVPLDPGNNTPYRSEVKTIDYGLSRSSQDSTLYYTGKVSHPFTKVELVGAESGELASSTEADKFGFWKLSLPGSSYPLTTGGIPDKIILKYTKKDLTGVAEFSPVNGVTFEPLLRYIEGYAFNAAGQVIPFAKVGIRQVDTDTVAYLTTADAKGFFRLGTQYLPSFPYDLVFTNPETNESIVVTSWEFVKDNKDYLVSEGLNLVKDENRQPAMVTASIASLSSLNPRSRTGEKISPPPGQVPAVSGNPAFFTLLFLSILVLAIAVLFFFKLFKRENKI